MTQQYRRPLQIPDMLILIAASAVAIALMKRHWDVYLPENFLQPPNGWTRAAIVARVMVGLAHFGPYIGTILAIALLGIRLYGPRPARPRLTRQPGLAACATVALMVALGEVEYLARVLMRGVDNPFRSGFSYETALVLMDGIRYSFAYNGHAVAAAWLTLAIGARWRPAPDWVDRCGRAVGFYWLLMIPLFTWFSIMGWE
jgi:hypothetical protein